MSRVLWTGKPMGATILSVALLVLATGCSSVPPPHQATTLSFLRRRRG